MGRLLLKKTTGILNKFSTTLSEFGKGASYALRN